MYTTSCRGGLNSGGISCIVIMNVCICLKFIVVIKNIAHSIIKMLTSVRILCCIKYDLQEVLINNYKIPV